MNSVTGYSIDSYGAMVTDKVRMMAYAESLRKFVNNDSVVMDIGAGTGVLSLLACQFGARHVYAIEPDDSIRLARLFAEANGYADRITFIQNISTRIELPERANLIVSDLRGVLPFFEQHIPSIADARLRHLAPGGVLIPQRDRVWAGLVEAAEQYQQYLEPWSTDFYGLDFSSNRKVAVNSFHNQKMDSGNVLSDPVVVADLNYGSATNQNLQAKLKFEASRSGTVHGISLWFETELCAGVGYSTAPDQERLVYGMGLLLLSQPVAVDIGQRIGVELKANLVGGDYVWQWNTEFFETGNQSETKLEFRQSTFDASISSIESLRKRASGHIPELSDEGNIQRSILAMMDGKASLEAISRRVTALYPGQYPKWEDALGLVGKLSAKYGL